MKYVSSRFGYFAPGGTAQHSLESAQCTFEHCTGIFECFGDGGVMWFAWEALKLVWWKGASSDDFGGVWWFAYFFEMEGCFAKELSSGFCRALACLPWEYEGNRIFEPCREIKNLCDSYRQALLRYSKRHTSGVLWCSTGTRDSCEVWNLFMIEYWRQYEVLRIDINACISPKLCSYRRDMLRNFLPKFIELRWVKVK